MTQTISRIAPSLVMKRLGTYLLVCLSSFCTGCKDPDLPPRTVSQALLTQKGASPSISEPQSLIQSLDKPYGPMRASKWMEFLDQEQTQAGRGFDRASREKLFEQLHNKIRNTKPQYDGEVVIIELIRGDPGTRLAVYDRYALFTFTRSEPAFLDWLRSMGFTKVDSAPWKTLKPHIARLLSIGGNNSGLSVVFDVTDAVVVSHYANGAWRSETWFWMSIFSHPEDELPEAAAQLPEHVRDFLNILQLSEKYTDLPLPESNPYRILIDAYGEYR